jgi:hypothetical protein
MDEGGIKGENKKLKFHQELTQRMWMGHEDWIHRDA